MKSLLNSIFIRDGASRPASCSCRATVESLERNSGAAMPDRSRSSLVQRLCSAEETLQAEAWACADARIAGRRQQSASAGYSQAAVVADVITFGPFQLDRVQRRLLRDGQPLPIGSRAMGILLALTDRPGAILGTRDLLRHVWRNIFVEDGTIRVHVGLLRRILRDGESDNYYVQNVAGRGYRFIAPVAEHCVSADSASVHASNPAVPRPGVPPALRKNDLPPLPTSVFGRALTIDTLVALLPRQRFVTVTGAGGIGKTTVAVSVAHTLAEAPDTDYSHGVCFIDLAAVTEPESVAGAMACALGLAPLASDPLPEILACLSKQSLLLVLDNCEHVIHAAARLAESVLRNSPQVHILATSREPLRARDEVAHDLAPLTIPAANDPFSQTQLRQSPAIQLFVERAGAHVGSGLDADDLLVAASLCRRLAGNPLAIEIAAAQVHWLGLRALEASLHDDLYLSIAGRRTAQPRQQTLRATFDWSYNLLSAVEQAVFRRLSAFGGSFDLDAAAALVADENLTYPALTGCLVNLARKSLIVAETVGDELRYRLLDLPRAHAREKLRQADELAPAYRRHSQTGR